MSMAADSAPAYTDPVVAAATARGRVVLYYREGAGELTAACGAASEMNRLERHHAQEHAGLRPCPQCFPEENNEPD